MRAAVHVNLTPDMRTAFEDHDDALLFGQLNDLGRKRSAHGARPAWRKAKAFRIVFRFVQGVVVIDGRSPGLKRNKRLRRRAPTLSAVVIFGRIGRKAGEILNRGQTPDAFLSMVASQIYRAIRAAGRGLRRAIRNPTAGRDRSRRINDDGRPEPAHLGEHDSIGCNRKKDSDTTVSHVKPPSGGSDSPESPELVVSK